MCARFELRQSKHRVGTLFVPTSCVVVYVRQRVSNIYCYCSNNAYSALTPAAFTTFAYFSKSVRFCAAYASGVLPTGSIPSVV